MSGRLLIINPVAGQGTDPVEIARTVRGIAGAEARIRVTAEAGDARRFGTEAAESKVEQVWVAGGDGTLNEVVTGLRDGPDDAVPELVPLPLGTGNDLARSLGIPLDWDEAARALGAASRIVELDLMEVSLDGEQRLGLNAVVVGNGGRVGEVLDRDGKSWWGPLAYLRSAAEVAVALEPVEVELHVDGGPPESRRLLNVIVANGRYAGHGIPIAPGARPDDGVLEFVAVDDTTLAAVLGMLPALLDESEPPHEAWEQRTVTSSTVEAGGSEPLPVSVDGENLAARRVSVALGGRRTPVRVPAEPAGGDHGD